MGAALFPRYTKIEESKGCIPSGLSVTDSSTESEQDHLRILTNLLAEIDGWLPFPR